MNALIIVFISSLLFLGGYFLYGSYLRKAFGIDPQRPTPAQVKRDKVDWVASHHWTILFGHHFSSIAGAGPILGPIIAISLWGWGPSLLWIVLGAVLLGGMHDFGSLIVSVRNDARTIANISGDIISEKTKIFFSTFVLLALILVIAVFAVLSAQTFVIQPEIIVPSLGLIPLAILVGIALYKLRFNQILVTILGLVVLLLLLFLGNLFPLKVPFREASLFWMAILFFYCYFASILPVNLLLQPRDYLSGFLLFFGLIFGYLGIFISSPKINLPFFISWDTKNGYLWPMLFVTIACGAISGFHSLVSSGTTSKQIANEKDALKIGYGAMVMEGLLAIMTLLIIVAGFSSQDALNKALQNYGGPIGVFGEGFGKLTGSFLFGYREGFALLIINAFVLTTLDTATRIGRYLFSELFKIKNRYLSTLTVVLISSLLAFTGRWEKLWPIFGASNQLVAGLALIVIATWLILQKKKYHFVIFPAFFMLLTTIGALIFQLKNFFKEKNFLLIGIDLILILFSLFVVWESRKIILRRKR